MATRSNVIQLVDHRGAPMARYDAGSVSRRTAGWLASRGTGPNREIAADLSTVLDRSRDLARNNPWARRAINAIVNNWVGSGIRAQWASARRQKRWTGWFESTDIDADGRLDGYGLQSLIARAVVESGSALIRKRPRRMTDSYSIPLQIQVLEPDWIDRAKNDFTIDGGYIVQGIQFNALGQRTHYWLYPEHPGDQTHRHSMISQPKPADEFLHVYRIDRPGQVHGMPWATGAYLRLRMLDDLHDAVLERQRQSACFMAFVRDIEPGDATQSTGTLVEKFEPGLIEILPPGKSIEFADPPDAPNHKDLETAVLLAVAADYGIPYEVMTGDLSRVNFSSARMGFQEFGRSIESWRWQLFAPQFLTPLVGWYLEAEAVAGYTGRPEVPLWTAPARQIVDPAREIPAIRDAVRSGLMSLPQAIRAMGFDPAVLVQEHADFLAVLDKLGVAFDSDGRHATSGPSEQKAVEKDPDSQIQQDDADEADQ